MRLCNKQTATIKLTPNGGIGIEANKALLDIKTIQAAVAGEAWAVEKVTEHYADEIDRLCTVTKKLPNGRTKKVIDEDMRQKLLLSLIEALPNFEME